MFCHAKQGAQTALPSLTPSLWLLSICLNSRDCLNVKACYMYFRLLPWSGNVLRSLDHDISLRFSCRYFLFTANRHHLQNSKERFSKECLLKSHPLLGSPKSLVRQILGSRFFRIPNPFPVSRSSFVKRTMRGELDLRASLVSSLHLCGWIWIK